MLAQEASGLGRGCSRTMSETRPEPTDWNHPNQRPHPRSVRGEAASVNVPEPQSAAPERQHHGKQGANERPHLRRFGGLCLLMLTTITALYLGAHVVAAIFGWQASALLLVVVCCALVVSSVLTAAARGGAR